MDRNTRLMMAVGDMINEYSFNDILDALTAKAIVKGDECDALGCKADARRLHTLARKIYEAREKAFGPRTV